MYQHDIRAGANRGRTARRVLKPRDDGSAATVQELAVGPERTRFGAGIFSEFVSVGAQIGSPE